MNNNQDYIVISGTVDNVVYRNDDNGFTVLELNNGEDLITVVGELTGVDVGEELKLTGNYTSHPTFGYQFKAELCERNLPKAANAIMKYLSGGAIKGIGPVTARNLVEHFDDKTLEIIEKEPMRLCEVKGITEAKAQKISEEFKKIYGIRSVMAYLSAYNITPAQAISVWRKWGTASIELISDNPYLLCDDDIGASFFDIDTLSETMNIPKDSDFRIRSGIMYVLSYNFYNGHTCLPIDKLTAKSCELLQLEPQMIEEEIEAMVATEYLTLYENEHRKYIYQPHVFMAERFISDKLTIMIKNYPNDLKCSDREIDNIEKKLDISFEAMQRVAIKTAATSPVMILTGGPGTGKTTTLKGIIEYLKEKGEKIAIAAPTGRAAKRISELTGEDAKTIHRLLEVDFTDRSGGIKFKHNERNPLKHDVVIIDELSMVDVMLFESLISAVKMSCRLILVGDYNQLPSVGPGNVLRDLIRSDTINTVELTEIFRQASQSLIVTNAHSIIEGNDPELRIKDNDFFFIQSSSYEKTTELVIDLCNRRLPNKYGYSPLADIQVIAPSKIGENGTIELNRRLQSELNPKHKDKKEVKFGTFIFREGDKVMQVKNNYDVVFSRDDGEQGTGIYNGDIGIIDVIDRSAGYMRIKFDDKITNYSFDFLPELELAYAITVHKSQGSEYEAVIIPLMNSRGKLYYRNLLYTAVTRAKKMLILIGSASAIKYMVSNNKKNLRYSNLMRFLKAEFDR